jgi:hypothetical protein
LADTSLVAGAVAGGVMAGNRRGLAQSNCGKSAAFAWSLACDILGYPFKTGMEGAMRNTNSLLAEGGIALHQLWLF